MLEPVDVEHPVEMVELVLEDAREPPMGLELERRAVEPGGAQQRAVRALEGKAFSRHRQAPLAVVPLVGLIDRRRADPQLGVDGDSRVSHVVFVGPVPDEQARVDADLGSREAYSRGLGHRVPHVGDEALDGFVDGGHGGGGSVQHGLADNANRKNGHTRG